MCSHQWLVNGKRIERVWKRHHEDAGCYSYVDRNLILSSTLDQRSAIVYRDRRDSCLAEVDLPQRATSKASVALEFARKALLLVAGSGFARLSSTRGLRTAIDDGRDGVAAVDATWTAG